MGLTTPRQKNLMLGDHGGGQDPHGVVASVKKKKKKNLVYISYFLQFSLF
jgi:hypothetical protein